MIRGLVIRGAKPDDHDGIAALVEAAFRPARRSAAFVERLRKDGDLVLDLVGDQ